MAVFIGTSGWMYRHWRGRFYPDGVAQKRWLEHYARHFATVESNNAFYMLPKPETFRAWGERTPDDFVIAVKANRFITHIRRLRNVAEPVRRFLDSAGNLGQKLGPVLLQLPPNLKADVCALDQTLKAFGQKVPLAVEFRHGSWFADDIRAVLERRGAALCLADRGSRPITTLWRTAECGYLRFHEGRAEPVPCYGKNALRSWAERLADLFEPKDDVYVYFNNDAGACAVRDAALFATEVETVGLEASRVVR